MGAEHGGLSSGELRLRDESPGGDFAEQSAYKPPVFAVTLPPWQLYVRQAQPDCPRPRLR